MYRTTLMLQVCCCLLMLAAPVMAAEPMAEHKSDAAPEVSKRYLIGKASIDITPDYPIRLNGFGFRRAESEGVRHKIHAKALAIRSEQGHPVLLIACDTLGIPDTLAERLAARIKEKTGVPRDRIAFTATHTHTAPMIRDVSPTIFGTPIPGEHQKRIDRYSDELAAALEKVALEALAQQTPAQLSYGIGQVRFAANRRAQGGPVDHDLPLLVARSPDGKLLAVWASYACHCVTLSENRIGGDWAGYAQSIIEREHAGGLAMISIGCGADANPNSGVTGDKADVAEAQGLEIAKECNRLLAAGLTPLSGDIATKFQRIELNLANLPDRYEWERRAKLDSAMGFYARVNLGRLDRGEALATKISYPVQSWTFADRLAIVFLPGEVVVDYSQRLKRELDAARLWINAYANACPGYVPSERVLKEGGYEGGGAMVYYDIPAPYAAGLEDKIVAAVRRQLDRPFQAQEAARR